MEKNKKVVAVWMDSNHATIIATENRASQGDFEIITTIDCEDHDGANFKNEKVEHTKELQEQKKYFKSIASQIEGDHVIYVFGPGKAQEQFKNFLHDYQNFNAKEITLGTSDKISHNEMIVRAKSFFDHE